MAPAPTPIPQPTILKSESLALTFPEHVDSTMLSSADSCLQKFFLEFMQHWSPQATSIDLHAGGAMAAGIEAVRRALWQRNLEPRAAVIAGVRAFIMYWGDFEAPEGHTKSFTNVLLAMMDYFQTYHPNSDPVKPYIMQNGAPAVEFTFAYPTDVMHPETGDPILYAGRFDLLGYFNKTLYIIDEKTSGRGMSAEQMQLYKMRGQFLGYAWAARMSGFKVNDALVRLIVIQKTQFQQLPIIVSLPDWQIDRWYEEMNHKLRRLVDCWTKAHWPYSYGDACSSWGGCTFLQLCTAADPSIWIGDFTKRTWDPLKRDPTWDE